MRLFHFTPGPTAPLIAFLFAFLISFLPASWAQQQTECATDQLHEHLFEQDPVVKQKHEQIRLRLQEHARKIIQQRMRNPNYELETRMVLTIPVVFHIMHNEGEAVGTGSNISDARITTEIANWNDAFRNIGAYAGGPFHTTANNGANTVSGNGISSVDVEIEFCLATQDPLGFPTNGITRNPIDFGNPLLRSAAGIDGNTRRDRDMQAISFWPTEDYFNVWVVEEICGSTDTDCGVAGYAYFPSSSGRFYDGSVIEARFIGASSAASAIMVHEAGHYLGLPHTFSGGCGDPNSDCTSSGDGICDTPPDNSTSSVSCSSGSSNNSCSNDATMTNSPFSSDVTDMYENYMDYGRQSCQNTFTPDQKSVMRNSLTNDRPELLTSAACAVPVVTGTEVAFAMTTREASEYSNGGNDCRGGQRDLHVRLIISKQPTSPVTLTFNTAGTATPGVDYELLSSNLVFSPTGATYGILTVRLFDDAALEGDETILLSYTIGGPANPAAVNQSMEITVFDNDAQPVGPGSSLLSENFEGGTLPTDWSISAFFSFTDNRFIISDNIGGNGNGGITGNYSAHITDINTNDVHTYDNSISSYPLLWSAPIDARAAKDVRISFKYMADGEAGSGGDYGALWYKHNGVNSGLVSGSSGPFAGNGNAVNDYSEIHNELDGKLFQLGFTWRTNNNGNGSIPFAIDDLVITSQTVEIETEVNEGITTQEDQQYLGPNATVFFYDQTTGKVMAKIENSSPHDYGCTVVSIDRSTASEGNDVAGFWTPTPGEFLAAKTFVVTPSNNKADGTYNITLYYTETEVNNWIAATGKTLADLKVVKNPTKISDVSTNAGTWGGVETVAPGIAITGPNFGNNGYAIEASFSTGFSGFGIGDPGNAPLPVEWLSFSGEQKGSDIELIWETTYEFNNDYFSIERLEKSNDFRQIGVSAAKENPGSLNVYQFKDPSPFEGLNTYRLKQVDKDGQYEYSKTLDVFFDRPSIVRVHPNPFHDKITLEISLESANEAQFQLFDMAGKMLKQEELEFQGFLKQDLQIEELVEGIYLYKVDLDGEVYMGKLHKI